MKTLWGWFLMVEGLALIRRSWVWIQGIFHFICFPQKRIFCRHIWPPGGDIKIFRLNSHHWGSSQKPKQVLISQPVSYICTAILQIGALWGLVQHQQLPVDVRTRMGHVWWDKTIRQAVNKNNKRSWSEFQLRCKTSGRWTISLSARSRHNSNVSQDKMLSNGNKPASCLASHAVVSLLRDQARHGEMVSL